MSIIRPIIKKSENRPSFKDFKKDFLFLINFTIVGTGQVYGLNLLFFSEEVQRFLNTKSERFFYIYKEMSPTGLTSLMNTYNLHSSSFSILVRF